MSDAAHWLARVRQLESRGELLLAYDIAMQGLDAHPGDVWLAHRAVLNLAKAGATARAEAEFTRLGLETSHEPDVAALGARIAKDRALHAPAGERTALLSHAADLYQAIYDRSGGYYPGVNVATLRLLAGEADAAGRMAREVLALCRAPGASPEDAYYRAASEAEAALVLGDAAAAGAALRRAAALGSDFAARSATRKQLRLVCDARGVSPDVLAPLAPPTVIHYTGHMIARAGGVGPRCRCGRGLRGSRRHAPPAASGLRGARHERRSALAAGAPYGHSLHRSHDLEDGGYRPVSPRTGARRRRCNRGDARAAPRRIRLWRARFRC